MERIFRFAEHPCIAGATTINVQYDDETIFDCRLLNPHGENPALNQIFWKPHIDSTIRSLAQAMTELYVQARAAAYPYDPRVTSTLGTVAHDDEPSILAEAEFLSFLNNEPSFRSANFLTPYFSFRFTKEPPRKTSETLWTPINGILEVITPLNLAHELAPCIANTRAQSHYAQALKRDLGMLFTCDRS